MSAIGRKCNICEQKIGGGLEGMIAHGEEHHPDHYLSGAGPNGELAGRTLEFVEKNYWCPLDSKWYSSRKYLARTIKNHGMTNEQYFNRYGRDHMRKEWEELTTDEKLGDARATPECKHCGKITKFNEPKWQYPAFCTLSCSTKWHAENTDRIERAMATSAERKLTDPTHQLRPNQIAYWTNQGFSEEEAREKVTHRQKAGSLERLQEKYGEELGAQMFNDGLANRKEAIFKSDMFKGTSRVADRFFAEVEKQYGKPLLYGENETHIHANDSKSKYIWVDCLDRENRKVIEFFGDYWHCAPHKFLAEDTVKFQRGGSNVVKDIWKYDAERISRIKAVGYDILVIWEHEYEANPEWAMTAAMGFLTGSSRTFNEAA